MDKYNREVNTCQEILITRLSAKMGWVRVKVRVKVRVRVLGSKRTHLRTV